MTLPYRFGSIVLLLSAAFTSGFFYGRISGHAEKLKNTVIAFENREKIDGEVANLDFVDLCIALGGLRDECEQLLPGLDEAAAGKLSGKNDKRRAATVALDCGD